MRELRKAIPAKRAQLRRWRPDDAATKRLMDELLALNDELCALEEERDSDG
jgi:hypothetical protein